MKLQMRMMILIPLLMLGIASCANNAPREAPDWSIAELPSSDITNASQLPILCKVVAVENDGERLGAWSAECWQAMQSYELVSQANFDIANSNAEALRSMEAAYGAVINAGKMERELSEYFQDELADEKRQRFYDNILFKSLLGIGLIFAIP